MIIAKQNDSTWLGRRYTPDNARNCVAVSPSEYHWPSQANLAPYGSLPHSRPDQADLHEPWLPTNAQNPICEKQNSALCSALKRCETLAKRNRRANTRSTDFAGSLSLISVCTRPKARKSVIILLSTCTSSTRMPANCELMLSGEKPPCPRFAETDSKTCLRHCFGVGALRAFWFSTENAQVFQHVVVGLYQLIAYACEL